jgi:flagellar motor switch protein FliM
VSKFLIELEGGGGHLHITYPYSMLEPYRELLDAGLQSDRMDKDERWGITLREQLQLAEVELETQLANATISLRDLMRLKPGDIIPINLPKSVDLCVEGVPVYRGQFGVANGHNAVRITDTIRRPPSGAARAA